MKVSSPSLGLMLSLALLCCTVTAGAEDPLGWKKPIGFPEGKLAQQELVAVPLDAVAYSRCSEELDDLRILDAAGTEVPYRLLKRSENRERTIEKTWSAENLSLKPLADGLDIRFSLDDDDPQPTSLQIETPLKNFEQRVRVFCLADEQETLLADDAIFDYSQYMDVRRVDLPLNKNSFRSFRIMIDQLTSEQESHILNLTRNLQGETEQSRQERFSVNRRPFRIDRIGLGRREVRIEFESMVEQKWDISIENISQDANAGQTIVEFSTFRQPLAKLSLVTTSQNFGRRVHLEVPVRSALREDWNRIASGTVTQLKYRDIDEQKLELVFPETRSETYRLVIENRNSPPLAIDGLEAFGHVHQLLFLAQPEETYELQYGQETEFGEPREYDTVAIDRFIAAGVAPLRLELGTETEDSRVPPAAFSLTKLMNNSLFLGGLILIMAVLLCSGLYRAVKRVDALDDSQPE